MRFSESVNMETENKTNGIDEFVGEFEAFHKVIRQKAGEIENEHIVTLYAIFKKNGRAEAMNGNGNGYGYKKKSDPNAPATDKQKGLISSLMKKGKVQQTSLDGLTKRDASRLLDEAFGKGRGSPSSFSSSPSPRGTEKLKSDRKDDDSMAPKKPKVSADLKITDEYVYKIGECETCGFRGMVQFANDGMEIVGLCKKHAEKWDY